MKFMNAAKQVPVVETLLPLDTGRAPDAAKDKPASQDRVRISARTRRTFSKRSCRCRSRSGSSSASWTRR